MTYYLYLKQHNVTGLKYLGQTIRDPFRYRGSGVYWKRHIKKHGYDVTTTILAECESEEELKQYGIKYSEKFDVVGSKEFANLRPETGDGGSAGGKMAYWYGKHHSDETRKKLSAVLKGTQAGKDHPFYGRRHSKESRAKMSAALKGTQKGANNPFYGETHDSAARAKMRKAKLGKKLPPRTPEWSKKISEARKRTAKIECPHCGMVGDPGGMKHWHFDRCKAA